MKKFRFNLQAALDYAEHCENVEQMELKALLMERNQVSRQHIDTQRRLRRTEEELSRKREILPDEIQVYDRFIASLRRFLQELARRLRSLDDKVIRQREILVEAARKRKTLDRLRARRQEEHTRQTERTFQQESDDLFLSRLGR